MKHVQIREYQEIIRVTREKLEKYMPAGLKRDEVISALMLDKHDAIEGPEELFDCYKLFNSSYRGLHTLPKECVEHILHCEVGVRYRP